MFPLLYLFWIFVGVSELVSFLMVQRVSLNVLVGHRRPCSEKPFKAAAVNFKERINID